MEYITLRLDSTNEIEQWYVRHNYFLFLGFYDVTIKEVPVYGLTNIRHGRTKFRRPGPPGFVYPRP